MKQLPLAKNTWEKVSNGTSPLSNVYYTTNRVSSEYVGKVWYDKYNHVWTFKVINQDNGDYWYPKKKGWKQLGIAKNRCWLSVINKPHKELAEDACTHSFEFTI